MHFENAKIIIDPEHFSIVETSVIPRQYFAIVNYGKARTVIMPSSQVDASSTLQEESGWRLLTFDLVLPFDMVGFLAEITAVLAAEHIAVFVLSSYQTDHLFIKEDKLQLALDTLAKLGFKGDA